LRSVHLSDFEVLSGGNTMSRSNLLTGSAPEIGDFSASVQSLRSGEGVTLRWSTANDSWDFIDVLGPVRGNSVTVFPTATTTYTLNSTNAYGRTTSSVTVEVH
jgi:hypothetical protein